MGDATEHQRCLRFRDTQGSLLFEALGHRLRVLMSVDVDNLAPLCNKLAPRMDAMALRVEVRNERPLLPVTDSKAD